MAKREEKEYDLSALAGRHYSKSNNIINAKGTTSLMAQKLFAVGVQQAELEKSNGQLVSKLYTTDLKKIFNANGGSFYEHIRELAEPEKDKPSLLDWRIVYTNDETEEIEAINVVTDCKYSDGVLEMRYNNKVTKELYELKENYTQFSLEETIPLKSIYSYRIYEILKSEYDKQSYIAHKRGENLDDAKPYVLSINLVDLKLRLGIIDPNENRDIINALKKSNVDFDLIGKLAEDAAKEKRKKENKITDEEDDELKKAAKYSDYSAFRKNTILVAQKELAKKTSISFEFEPIKTGRGGKVVGIRFFIRSKNKNKKTVIEEKVLTQEEKEEFIDQINELVEFKAKIKDLRAIADASEYDFTKVEKAYEVLKNVKGGVENPTGFMIKAIKDNYELPSGGFGQKKNSFNNFDQNEYDFDELERKLIDN